MATKKTAPNPPETHYLRIYSELARILNVVGLPGFVVLSLLTIFLVFADSSQKSYWIDVWLLLKHPETHAGYIWIVCMGIMLFFQQYYHQKAIKLKNTRIEELTTERNNLQALQLGIDLSSSKKIGK